MEYFNKFRSSVATVAQQVTQALPGNPIFREYEVVQECVASAGPGLSWKIYAGTKNTTKQAVSIWLFEKKQIEKWPRAEREAFPELLKRGVSQLTRLRHPRILTIDRTLEESRDNFAFCTEPVFASLANVFGDLENVDTRRSADDMKLSDIEIKHGIFQLSEALSFLHNDAKLLHGNVSPSSVIINARGAWKLAGFDFCILGAANPAGRQTFAAREWDRHTMSVMNPALDYAAPELIDGVKCDTYADIFSLGMLAAALFNSAYKPIISSKGLVETYKTKMEALSKMSIAETPWFKGVPQVFAPDLKACLNQTPELRPDAYQLTKVAYFDEPALKTLNYLESLMQMDNSQKMQFFKGLPQILDRFPKRVLLQKILPCLCDEFNNAELIPFILPSIFYIAEEADNHEFSTRIFPAMIPVFRLQKPYQIVLLLLQKMPLLLKKTQEADIKKHVLPLIYNSIGNENPRIQELCLSVVPTIGKLVDRDAMKTQLLPKLIKLILEGSVLSIRVQTLVCIGKLLPTLEPWMVSDQILAALPRINSKEPGILMAVLGIIKLAHENERFGISREQCARTILPYLISSCVENTLNLQQFEQFMLLTKTLMEKMEQEQRKRLQQLSAGQEEQIKTQNFDEIFSQTSSISVSNSTGDMNDLLSVLDRPKSAFTATNGSSLSQTAPLSLEEKKRLAAEQELQRSGGGQTFPALNSAKPMSGSSAGVKVAPTRPAVANKDLDLFGSKASNSDPPSSSLDMFDPFFSQRKTEAPPKANAANFSTNNIFGGGIPPPPSSSNPVIASSMNPLFGTLSSSPSGVASQKPSDPFDNLFSLKSAVQNPASFSLAPAASVMNPNNPQVTSKKEDPLDFLN